MLSLCVHHDLYVPYLFYWVQIIMGDEGSYLPNDKLLCL